MASFIECSRRSKNGAKWIRGCPGCGVEGLNAKRHRDVSGTGNVYFSKGVGFTRVSIKLHIENVYNGYKFYLNTSDLNKEKTRKPKGRDLG